MKTTLILSSFIILFLSLTSLAIGQTVITTIENEAGDPVLKSFDDGGFMLLGEFDLSAESVPIEGAGTRLMWYPEKAAFRAGQVTGSQWNEDNIGNLSIALGHNSTASEVSAIAVGSHTTASGLNSTAMGFNTTASGIYSTAMVSNSTASGERSIALGSYATASGDVSTAIGVGTDASGLASTAMGRYSEAKGMYSTTIGNSTIAASENSLSVGTYNDSNQGDDNSLFVVGNGDFQTRSDALRLTTSGNMTIAGSLTENSDRRLKTNIEPIGEATLDKLGSIQPVRYRFKNQQTHPEGTQIGLIAQQVQEHFPELVSENSSGYLSLSYTNLTTVLLKGMQEQQEEIVHLKERLTSLEQQNRQQAGLPVSSMLLIGFFTMAGAIGFWLIAPSLQKSGRNDKSLDKSVN